MAPARSSKGSEDSVLNGHSFKLKLSGPNSFDSEVQSLFDKISADLTLNSSLEIPKSPTPDNLFSAISVRTSTPPPLVRTATPVSIVRPSQNFTSGANSNSPTGARPRTTSPVRRHDPHAHNLITFQSRGAGSPNLRSSMLDAASLTSHRSTVSDIPRRTDSLRQVPDSFILNSLGMEQGIHQRSSDDLSASTVEAPLHQPPAQFHQPATKFGSTQQLPRMPDFLYPSTNFRARMVADNPDRTNERSNLRISLQQTPPRYSCAPHCINNLVSDSSAHHETMNLGRQPCHSTTRSPGSPTLQTSILPIPASILSPRTNSIDTLAVRIGFVSYLTELGKKGVAWRMSARSNSTWHPAILCVMNGLLVLYPPPVNSTPFLNEIEGKQMTRSGPFLYSRQAGTRRNAFQEALMDLYADVFFNKPVAIMKLRGDKCTVEVSNEMVEYILRVRGVVKRGGLFGHSTGSIDGEGESWLIRMDNAGSMSHWQALLESIM
ncbi:hypothetical protein BC830DRAFT_1163777 [Chytriomyces sp. MP71]|nr:hypothetical protein BC830DRAFT_1163777 [Chytriomyces sp. MP71]